MEGELGLYSSFAVAAYAYVIKNDPDPGYRRKNPHEAKSLIQPLPCGRTLMLTVLIWDSQKGSSSTKRRERGGKGRKEGKETKGKEGRKERKEKGVNLDYEGRKQKKKKKLKQKSTYSPN